MTCELNFGIHPGEMFLPIVQMNTIKELNPSTICYETILLPRVISHLQMPSCMNWDGNVKKLEMNGGGFSMAGFSVGGINRGDFFYSLSVH